MSWTTVVRRMLTVTVAVAAVLLASSTGAAAVASGGDAWLRSQLPAPALRPHYFVTSDYAVPLEVVIPGTGSYFDAARAGGLRASHARGFLSFDGAMSVGIRLTEWVSHEAAHVAPTHGNDPRLTFAAPLSPPDVAIVRLNDGAGKVKVHIGFSRGRVSAEIVVTANNLTGSSSGPVPAEVQAVAADFTNVQYGLMADSADISNQPISLANEQRTLFIATVVAIVAIQVLAALVAVLRDPAVGRRTRAAQDAGPPHAGVRVVDVAGAARRRRWRSRLGVVLRNVLFLGVFAALFSRSTSLGEAVTLGAIAFLFTCGEIVASRVPRRARYRASYGAGPIVIRLMASALAIAFAVAGALLVFLPLVSLNVTPAGVSTGAIRTGALIVVLIGVGLIGAAGLVARIGALLAASSTRRLSNRDGRDEILFLRSFMDEKLRIRAHRSGRQVLVERLVLSRFERFEEILSWQIWWYGPAVALAQPGQMLKPLGAARLVASNQNWLAVVREKITSSQFIVMSVGRTPAVTIEVHLIREAAALSRTIFILPPVTPEERQQRLAVLASALELDPAALTGTGPRRHLLAFYFDQSGQPVLVLGDKRDDLAYQAAVDVAGGAVLAQRAATLHAPADSVRQQGVPASVVAMPHVTTRRPWIRWAIGGAVTFVALCGLPGLLLVQLVAASAGPPPVPLPGQVISHSQTATLTADADGNVELWDMGAKALTRIGPGGRTTTQTSGYARQILSDSGVTFVAMTGPNQVAAFAESPSGFATLWTQKLDGDPGTMAAAADRLFITLPEQDAVQVIDTARGDPLGTVAVGRGPFSIVATDDLVLVANGTDGTISWLNATTLRVDRTQVFTDAAFLALAGNELLMTSILDSSITVVDIPTGDVIRSGKVPRPSGAAVVVGGRIAVATYETTPRVLFLNSETFAIEAARKLPQQVAVMAVINGELVCALPDVPAVITLT